MEYLIHLAILISIYSILAISLNLVIGYTGLLSVTHAAFFGTGAYATAILMTTTEMGFFTSVIVGIIVTAIISFLVGVIMSRFDGDMYALVSFGFNVIVFSIFLNWQELTRGPLGIPGIGKPEIFGLKLSGSLEFLILAVIFALIMYALGEYIAKSSFGRVLKAIREDEKAIQIFGYNTSFFKLAIFVIAAAMAAVAGSLYASYISFIDPSTFGLIESIFILSIVILGGLASNKGVVVGTIFLILLPEILRFVGFPTDVAAQMRQVVYGLLLILLMLYRPQGLMGEYKL